MLRDEFNGAIPTELSEDLDSVGVGAVIKVPTWVGPGIAAPFVAPSPEIDVGPGKAGSSPTVAILSSKSVSGYT